MSARAPAWLAWSVCGSSLALLTLGVVLTAVNRTPYLGLLYLVGVVGCALVGGLISSRRPANPVGWFFLGDGCHGPHLRGEETIR